MRRANRLIEAAKKKSKESGFVRQVDTIQFAIGIFRLLVVVFIAGRFPCYYPYWHTGQLILFMTVRFFHFR